MTAQHSIPLYEKVADTVRSMVEQGTFGPGDRVPSIRSLSQRLQVSVNTVKTAYGMLEDRRIIEARPQSGYYVCPRLPAIPNSPETDTAHFSLDPTEISSSAVVTQVMGDIMAPDLIQFGAAVPAPELVPTGKLNRILSAVVRRFPGESTGYAIPPGNKRLRTQLARRMLRAGCTLSPDQIIITNGATEAVFLALRALCKPGDTLAIGSPVYFNFLQLIKSLGLKVLEIPMTPSTGMDIAALEIALKRHRVQACLTISNFNNPLGCCPPHGAKRALLHLLGQYGIPLIEDDINGDITFESRRPPVIKSWDTLDNVLLCSSFSKTLAPGYRLGWIAPGRYFDAVKHQKLVSNLSTASPVQLAVAEFLVSGGYERHVRNIRKVYAAKVMQMADAVGKYFPPGTRVTRPSGGFTLWIELPRHYHSMTLYTMARARGISIAPGTIFSTTDRFAHYIRLNAAVWSDTTAWAVKTLGTLLSQISPY